MLEKCHQNCQAALAATGMIGYTYKYSMVEETELYRENPDRYKINGFSPSYDNLKTAVKSNLCKNLNFKFIG